MQPTIQKISEVCLILPYSHLSALEHLHASYEILVPHTGIARVRLDGREKIVRPGEVLVVFPGIPHSYDPAEEGTGMTMIFPEKMLSEQEVDWAEAQPAEPVVALEDVDRDAAYCLGRLEEMSDPRHMDENLARVYLALLMLRLRPALRLEEPVGPVSRDLLYRAMTYISQNMATPLSIRGVARALGVNNYYLSHVLNERLHMNFRTYLNALRVERARRLLRVTSRPIEEVGAACGFANLRTFDRVFSERCGCTPRDYRKSVAAPQSPRPKTRQQEGGS